MIYLMEEEGRRGREEGEEGEGEGGGGGREKYVLERVCSIETTQDTYSGRIETLDAKVALFELCHMKCSRVVQK